MKLLYISIVLLIFALIFALVRYLKTKDSLLPPEPVINIPEDMPVFDAVRKPKQMKSRPRKMTKARIQK